MIPFNLQKDQTTASTSSEKRPSELTGYFVFGGTVFYGTMVDVQWDTVSTKPVSVPVRVRMSGSLN
jgi:hypothetical protein